MKELGLLVTDNFLKNFSVCYRNWMVCLVAKNQWLFCNKIYYSNGEARVSGVISHDKGNEILALGDQSSK